MNFQKKGASMKKMFVLIITFLLLITPLSVLGSTAFFVGDNKFTDGQTLSISIDCQVGNEKNQAYTLNVTNSTGGFLEAPTGTMTGTCGVPVFESITLPTDYT